MREIAVFLLLGCVLRGCRALLPTFPPRSGAGLVLPQLNMKTKLPDFPETEPMLGDLPWNFEYITFVSSNQMKVREVQMILGDNFPWELRTHSVELFEPQAPPIEVSRSKCRQAVNICQGPVIVEDTSLCFNALNGLPGPYIKWFYEAVGNEGLAKMLEGYEDKTGTIANPANAPLPPTTHPATLYTIYITHHTHSHHTHHTHTLTHPHHTHTHQPTPSACSPLAWVPGTTPSPSWAAPTEWS
mmetsp:Transcript_17258/g.38297  ORF Transcript_17258/g.38297 Transcript_17258/m.38297 type:complete len:243 (-) Transcript_17258:371-1099(-)